MPLNSSNPPSSWSLAQTENPLDVLFLSSHLLNWNASCLCIILISYRVLASVVHCPHRGPSELQMQQCDLGQVVQHLCSLNGNMGITKCLLHRLRMNWINVGEVCRTVPAIEEGLNTCGFPLWHNGIGNISAVPGPGFDPCPSTAD